MPKDAISECVKAGQILAKLRQSRFPPIPDGWFTVDLFMKENGLGKTSAKYAIVDLIKSGSLIRQSWPVLGSSGRMHYISIYKTK